MSDKAFTPGVTREKRFSSFCRASLRELACNVRHSRKNLVFDALVLFACFALFECNNLIIKPWASSSSLEAPASAIILFHANDFLGGIAFMAYVNALLDLVRPSVRFRRLASTLAFMLFCGLFWEVVAPLFVPGSTGDILDVAAYLLGALVYWGLNRVKSVR